jgi:glutamate synthase (ferredoxin)
MCTRAHTHCRLKFEGGKAGALEAALKALCSDVEAAVRAGSQCVILTDRYVHAA